MFNYIILAGIISTMIWLNFIFAMKFPMLFFIALGLNFYVSYTHPDHSYFYLGDEEITTFDLINLLGAMLFLNLLIFFFVFMFYLSPIMMTSFVFINFWADYCRD